MLSLAFTGDIAFSKHFKNSYAKEDLLGEGIVDYLKDTDYVVANVEAPVTDGGITSKNSLVHANSPECIPTLKNINAKIYNNILIGKKNNFSKNFTLSPRNSPCFFREQLYSDCKYDWQ